MVVDPAGAVEAAADVDTTAGVVEEEIATAPPVLTTLLDGVLGLACAVVDKGGGATGVVVDDAGGCGILAGVDEAGNTTLLEDGVDVGTSVELLEATSAAVCAV